MKKINNAIGGYFELEHDRFGNIYHDEAIALNSGRSALEFILRNSQFSKVFVPLYICDTILQAFERTNTDHAFYKMDNNFLPEIKELDQNEAILYVNYFGVMENNVRKVIDHFDHVIIDNSQAFFSKFENTLSFYSPRKYFGVPDGGFAYLNKTVNVDYEKDISSKRISHLLTRIENSPEKGYVQFLENEGSFKNCKIKKMSDLTKALLRSVDFDKVKKRRESNYMFLNNSLSKFNELSPIVDPQPNGPMVYPFLNKKNKDIKQKLIENKIYIPTYWPDIKKRKACKGHFEEYLADNLLPLVIDQRYIEDDLNEMLSIVIRNM